METKVLAGGAPFYGVYICKDGRHVSVGCLEPQFFKTFVELFVLEVEVAGKPSAWKPSSEAQIDPTQWPKMREYFTRGFLTRDRDCWSHVFHGEWSLTSLRPQAIMHVPHFIQPQMLVYFLSSRQLRRHPLIHPSHHYLFLIQSFHEQRLSL